MTKRKYKNPSIVEAVFEIRFPSDNPWGMGSAVKYASLAKEAGFPEIDDTAEAFQLSFSFSHKDGEKPVVKPVNRRLQTWNAERNQLWQASSELYAANRRAPYLGWEVFRPHILKGFELYRQVAQPETAVQSVLQYINRIPFDETEGPGKFVSFVPPDTRYADTFELFTCQTQQSFVDGDKILVTSTRDPDMDSGLAVVLTIIHVTSSPSLEPDGLRQMIETGHQRIISAFEASVTDAQRERMEQI